MLCCAMHTGDRSQSRIVKSLGGGNKSKTPSHGCAGDNTAIAGSPTAWRVLLCSRYIVTEAGSLKTIEMSLSCGTWTFVCNIERKLTRVNQVRCVFILLTRVNQVRCVFKLLTCVNQVRCVFILLTCVNQVRCVFILLTCVNQVRCVFILLSCVNQVRCVFILLTKSLKLKFFLWFVFTLFCNNVIGGQAGGTGVQCHR